MTEDEAIKVLEKAGYYVGNLWQIDDVRSIFRCSKREAMEVLGSALTNEATMDQIWFSIEYFGDELGLKKKKR